MFIFSDKEKNDIKDSLKSRNAPSKCACGKNDYTILEGYLAPALFEQCVPPYTSSSVVPMLCVVCKSCGLINLYSSGLLELNIK